MITITIMVMVTARTRIQTIRRMRDYNHNKSITSLSLLHDKRKTIIPTIITKLAIAMMLMTTRATSTPTQHPNKVIANGFPDNDKIRSPALDTLRSERSMSDGVDLRARGRTSAATPAAAITAHTASHAHAVSCKKG